MIEVNLAVMANTSQSIAFGLDMLSLIEFGEKRKAELPISPVGRTEA
jgi:hypothetical protein